LAKSSFFARIKGDVLQIVAAIPHGRAVSFADVGAYLDVAPRHVAYILSTLEDDQKMMLPWYRAVADGGKLGTPKFAPDGTSQEELLREEGWQLYKGQLQDFEQGKIAVTELNSGVPKQSRPKDAPTL
jgi:methylated-DNA-protein-cysteine methyltransferase related protein